MRAQKQDPERFCEWCGARLERKRFTTGRLEDRGRFLKRRYCDKECQRLAQINPAADNRQTLYSRARKHRGDKCERCGSTENLHIHHRDTDISNNDPENLETLLRGANACLQEKVDRLVGEMREAVDDLQRGRAEDAIQRLLNAADRTPASDEGLRSGREDDDDPR